MRRQDSISGSYTTDVLKRLKVGGICSLLHRPLAYDLWFTSVPRCPQQERRISHCVNSLLFALSFKANYLLASFSPHHKWVLETIPGRKTLEFILWKMQTPLPSPAVVIKADPSPSKIKRLVWGKTSRKRNHSLTNSCLTQPKSFEEQKLSFFRQVCSYFNISLCCLWLFPGPLNAINLERQLYN